MQEVTTLCDGVVIVAGGRVQFAGTLEALKTETGDADVEDAFVRVVGSPAAAEPDIAQGPRE
jgi:sodium transport system ATP-binding protein